MALVNLRFEDPETAFVASQIANIIFNSLWFWSRALLLGCELRILLQMFLNLNPYFYPILFGLEFRQNSVRIELRIQKNLKLSEFTENSEIRYLCSHGESAAQTPSPACQPDRRTRYLT